MLQERSSEVSLCIVYDTNEIYQFYEFHPQPAADSVEPYLLHQVPYKNHPYRFQCGALGSKIYLLGGMVLLDEGYVPHSEVYTLDTSTACFQRGRGMLGGKAYPSVATLDGKIYAFGHALAHTTIDPWAEVFDPITNQWSALPYPPSHVIIGCTWTGAPHVAVYHKKKRILIDYDGEDICYFDTTCDSWGFYKVKPVEEWEPDKRLQFRAKPVVVEDTVYVFSAPLNQLFACNLEEGELDSVPVKGLEKATESVTGGPVFLFHLGNQHMCLIWLVRVAVWKECQRVKFFQVHCLNFHIEGTCGHLVAVPGRCNVFCTNNDVLRINDCFPIIRTAPSDIGSLDTAANPCFNPGAQPRDGKIDIASEETRHARRVYVDGFRAPPETKDIKRHFNCIGPDAVVDVFINKDTKFFAIVEMSSAQEVDKALALDGSSFQNSLLKIRRPTDYNSLQDCSNRNEAIIENGPHTLVVTKKGSSGSKHNEKACRKKFRLKVKKGLIGQKLKKGLIGQKLKKRLILIGRWPKFMPAKKEGLVKNVTGKKKGQIPQPCHTAPRKGKKSDHLHLC